MFYNFRLTGLKFPELENMAETCPNLDIFHILKHLKLIVKLKNVFRSFLTYLKSCYRVLKILFSQISDWLTDWLPYLLMPSEKCNSIMAIYSSTSLHPQTCLFANRSSSNACIMILSKLTFVLFCTPFLSLLPYRWWFLMCMCATLRLVQHKQKNFLH